jgi:hypothetical protein
MEVLTLVVAVVVAVGVTTILHEVVRPADQV